MAALGEDSPEQLAQLEEMASQQSQEQPSEEQVEVSPEIKVPKNFFKLPVHPMEALRVLRVKYVDNWVRWLPETLWTAIRRDVGAISEINQNKVQALATALSTDAPWQDWTTFENCGQAFNDKIPVFGQIQPLSPAETAFTVSILKKLHKFDFSEEVLGYIAAVCLYNGIIHAPAKWFDKVQGVIDRQLGDKELQPQVKAAWDAVRGKDLTDVEISDEKPIDVHIAKLWAIQEYLGEKNSRLKEA